VLERRTDAELKAASFASLQTRGNRYCQRVLSAWLAEPSGVYRSFITFKNPSYMEPFWFLSDCTAARLTQRSPVQNKTTTIELDRMFAHLRAWLLPVPGDRRHRRPRDPREYDDRLHLARWVGHRAGADLATRSRSKCLE
jgi:hypothetical protein